MEIEILKAKPSKHCGLRTKSPSARMSHCTTITSQHLCKSLPVTADILNTDKDALFYTGIPRKDLFGALHTYVSKFVHRRWR